MEFEWITARAAAADVVALRRKIYGGELGWIGEGSAVAWDAYDAHSFTLAVRVGGQLVASSRVTIDSDGPLEVSDCVDWRAALPAGTPAGVAAEWSRVMIAPGHRSAGLFRAMHVRAEQLAAGRGAVLFAGASVTELRPLYERLGFTYLDAPFRSAFFDASPVYYPAFKVIR